MSDFFSERAPKRKKAVFEARVMMSWKKKEEKKEEKEVLIENENKII